MGEVTMGDVPVQGEPLALDLVNTTFVRGGLRGRVVDALCEPEALHDWLAAHRTELGVTGLECPAGVSVGEPELRRFQELRQALREALTAETSGTTWPDAAVRHINRAAHGATRWRELSASAPTGSVEVWSTKDWATAALARVAESGVALLSGEQRDALRACRAPGCILFFVQSGPARQWCSSGCGNRVRVARHANRAKITVDDSG
ncbi:CGNR zinc finger domain-containing protein [Streptomyces brevispora]|uniref:CGNR zinc finger domain-containing protein n=1 Tax=Streptomyces brevispora TaxID=887462 RepID=UPI0037163BA9